MYRIVESEFVAPSVKRLVVEAPQIASHWRAGQFIILRVDDDGERIPLTVASVDRDEGTITLFVQGIGMTTELLEMQEAGDSLADVAGPLGKPSAIENYGVATVVGGGVGTAIAYPIAAALRDAGNEVIAIIGGRSADHVLLEDELAATGAQVVPCTDDGSRGRHGFVTEALADIIASRPIDVVFAAGPVPMMSAVAEVTRPEGIKTIASLNPIMVDGTGMCGGCRVVVGGETKFACVDGPEFDAHLVDFALLARRNKSYVDIEKRRLEEFECHLETMPWRN